MFYRVVVSVLCITLGVIVPVTQSAEPPNEWSTYYSLPSGHATIDVAFYEIFGDYTNGRNPETQCNPNEADFERWYISSLNSDHYILSYYCRTKAVRGYEHLKVDMSKRNVLEFQTSLKGFNIMDAGDYEIELAEEEGKKIETDLLDAVKEQIAEERRDSADKKELCPDPGTQTLYDIETKKENGLYYYRIAVSCNVSETPGYASHMTHIEVVVDRDFGALNEGNPKLAVMEYPSRNSAFIREQEMKSELQKDGVQNVAPGFISLIPVLWGAYLKLFA